MADKKQKYICTRKGCRLRDKNGDPYVLEVGKVYSFTDDQAAKLVNKIRKADVVGDDGDNDKLASLNAENAKQVAEIAGLMTELAEAAGHVKNAENAKQVAEKRADVAEKALASTKQRITDLESQLTEAAGHVKNALKAQKDAEKRADVAEKALASTKQVIPPVPSTAPTATTPGK